MPVLPHCSTRARTRERNTYCAILEATTTFTIISPQCRMLCGMGTPQREKLEKYYTHNLHTQLWRSAPTISPSMTVVEKCQTIPLSQEHQRKTWRTVNDKYGKQLLHQLRCSSLRNHKKAITQNLWLMCYVQQKQMVHCLIRTYMHGKRTRSSQRWLSPRHPAPDDLLT